MEVKSVDLLTKTADSAARNFSAAHKQSPAQRGRSLPDKRSADVRMR